MRMSEAIKDRSLAKELCIGAKKRVQKAVTDLLTFQWKRKQ